MSIASDTIFDSISGYAVAGKADDDAYNKLRDVAVASFNMSEDPDRRREDFEHICREAEDEFCEVNYAGDPKAKHTAGKRKGQWKYRTLLPGAYSSARSTLAGALGDGVNPAGMGKTAVSKARGEAKGGVDPSEKIRKAKIALRNALAKLDETNPAGAAIEREGLRDWIGTI